MGKRASARRLMERLLDEYVVVLVLTAAYAGIWWGLPGPSIVTVAGRPLIFGLAAIMGVLHLTFRKDETRILFVALGATAPASRILSLVIEDHAYSTRGQFAALGYSAGLCVLTLAWGRDRIYRAHPTGP